MSLIFTAPAQASRRRNSIYIGGKTDAKSRAKLEQWGITHILNMTPQKDSSVKAGVPNYFENKGKFVYKRISVYDASTTDLLSDAPEIVAFISKGLNYGSVLVHCQRGVSRSSTAVMFYLMNAAGMSFDNAFKTCQRRRDCVDPIPAFVAQLKEYETECKRKGLIQSNGGEVKSNLTADKKRKVAGPSRGPAPRPMVGPSLPPQEDEKDDEKIKSSSNPDIGPSLPSQKKAKIGPSLPSQQKKKENSSS